MEQSHTSGTNTVLLVIILMALVGAIVWFLAAGNVPTEETDRDLQVDVTLPTPQTGNTGGESSNPTN